MLLPNYVTSEFVKDVAIFIKTRMGPRSGYSYLRKIIHKYPKRWVKWLLITMDITYVESYYTDRPTDRNDFDAWEAYFEPHKNEDESYFQEVYSLIGIDKRHLWTVVDADGRLVLQRGLAVVNRIGYFHCKWPWEDDDLFEMRLPSEPGDDNDTNK